MLVVDASIVVAALVDSGTSGTWARTLIRREPIAAPHLMPYEVSNVLRRLEAARTLTADNAALAHRDLVSLPVDLAPHRPFADRIRQLGSSLSAYDAAYVALAESLDADLATLDARLSRAAGPGCSFLLPPAS